MLRTLKKTKSEERLRSKQKPSSLLTIGIKFRLLINIEPGT